MSEHSNPPASSPEVIVAHYREVGLKGRNRSFFERRLVENMRRRLSALPAVTVKAIPGRIIVRPGSSGQTGQVLAGLQTVFGLSSFSAADELLQPSMENLASAAVQLARRSRIGTFAVRARRGNTSFSHTSGEINVVVGQAIKDACGARVDLSRPEWTCYIEMVADRAYLYSEKVSGPGGLPVGTSGKVLTLLSGGIDSPVAAWQIARRGAAVDFVHFHGQPFSDASSSQQARRLAGHLLPWLMRSRLWMVPFGDVQSEIVTSAPERLRIVLYRRMMMRIAEAIARGEGAEALVTGESLGQVASQTLPNMAAIGGVVDLPVLRPLIGLDKLEIEQIAERIGTYGISIEPHQDCCVLFTPREVTTAAKPQELEQAEAALDVDALVEKALANAEAASLEAP